MILSTCYARRSIGPQDEDYVRAWRRRETGNHFSGSCSFSRLFGSRIVHAVVRRVAFAQHRPAERSRADKGEQ